MGRLYTATFRAVAVTAAQDLFAIVAPTDAVVAIHDIDISQTSDVGDAAEELIRVSLKSGASSAGSGGTLTTAIPIQYGDAAFGGTVRINDTTIATSGTIVVHRSTAWNVRAPLNIIFTPETRPILSPSRRFVVGLIVAPADSLTMNGTITFEEIGG